MVREKKSRSYLAVKQLLLADQARMFQGLEEQKGSLGKDEWNWRNSFGPTVASYGKIYKQKNNGTLELYMTVVFVL